MDCSTEAGFSSPVGMDLILASVPLGKASQIPFFKCVDSGSACLVRIAVRLIHAVEAASAEPSLGIHACVSLFMDDFSALLR